MCLFIRLIMINNLFYICILIIIHAVHQNTQQHTPVAILNALGTSKGSAS